MAFRAPVQLILQIVAWLALKTLLNLSLPTLRKILGFRRGVGFGTVGGGSGITPGEWRLGRAADWSGGAESCAPER